MSSCRTACIKSHMPVHNGIVSDRTRLPRKMVCDRAHCAVCGLGRSHGSRSCQSGSSLINMGRYSNSPSNDRISWLAASLKVPAARDTCGGTRNLRELLLFASRTNCFQPAMVHNVFEISSRELSQTSIRKSFGQQPIAAVDAAFRPCSSTQSSMYAGPATILG